MEKNDFGKKSVTFYKSSKYPVLREPPIYDYKTKVFLAKNNHEYARSLK